MEGQASIPSFLWFAGTRVLVRVRAAQSEGRIGAWESEEWFGTALPLHVHTREDEQVMVLDGEAAFRVGDQVHRLAAGDSLRLPRGVPHAHLVTSAQARFMTIATPAGFERLFSDMGTPALPGTSAPPADIDALTEAVTRLGVRIVGPPPAFE